MPRIFNELPQKQFVIELWKTHEMMEMNLKDQVLIGIFRERCISGAHNAICEIAIHLFNYSIDHGRERKTEKTGSNCSN